MKKEFIKSGDGWIIDDVEKFKALENIINENGEVITTGTGFAPHVVSIGQCGYMAVNKFCVVSSHILDERIHKYHKIEVVGAVIGTITRPLIYDLLEEMELRNTYKITIYNAMDFNEQIAPFSILAAIWKSLSIFEKPAATHMEEDSIWGKLAFFNYLLNSKAKVEGKVPVAIAVIFGSIGNVHLPSLDGVDKQIRKVKSGPFSDNYDLLFVRTNCHTSDYEPKQLRSRLNERVKILVECMNSESDKRLADTEKVPAFMTFVSEREYGSVTFNELQSKNFEQECYAALENVRNKRENFRVFKGFEIQQGGILLALKKHAFEKNENLLKEISNSIVEHSRRIKNVTQISFNLLQPARGAFLREYDPTAPKFRMPTNLKRGNNGLRSNVESNDAKRMRMEASATERRLRTEIWRRQRIERARNQNLRNDDELSNDDTYSEISTDDERDRSFDEI
ncbi:hypothetical protein GCK72_024887 [Caenorhabditis remanei]|uniref:Uncharacterized protein n=1 Tax=Caenorhabditis remanei TaxID=31234 RepID=A0A6A5G0G6_CAERE|nr:hypothetical protein GCK72_024887 [Caenorhabditis remanei]KAF1748420.1 hypothetical protein GCK72_024887 [Caenorhabditis remanei]